MSLFSGGVDSFYTVLTPRAWPIDDLLVIHGAFDLMYAKRESFDRVQARLQAAADALGKVLIPSATNLLHTRLGRDRPLVHVPGVDDGLGAARARALRFAHAS